MNAPLPPDPYRALGVESSADAGAIKTAYRKLVLKCHPDKFPDPTLKAQKQEEFQAVQQAYEIIGDEDRRRDYDLEVKAKKLKEELAKRGGAAGTSTSARYVNVNIRTAEPPPGWSPSKHSTSKSSPYKPYSKEFSQSWDSDIPSRSRAYHDEERRARRTASYEKPKREDSRERSRRQEDREREKRREREREEEARKEIKRQQKLTKEREAARERDRERKERKVREEREAAKLKEAKKMRERERERERDARRKQDEEKSRAKSKPYLEHSGYSEDDDDVRRSRAKKSSSPKKQSDSPSRETATTKQRDRSNPRESAPVEEKYRETMASAASYIQKMRSKASKSSPRHAAEVPAYSTAYPDPNEKWAPKRRTSGEGKHAKDEPVIVDVPDPDKIHPEVVSPSSNTQQAPPRLQKSHTMPSGYMPQTQTTAPVPPPRVPLNRAFTMQPEHEYGRPVEKHRSARRRMSFDEDEEYYPAPIQTTYHVSRPDRGIPRIIDTKYKDPYAAAPGVTFSKVKTAPSYGAEHVATSRRYGEDDVMTADYSHMQPSYDYRTAAVR